MFSKQLNISDFGLEKQFTKNVKRLLKNNKIEFNFNKLVKFIEKKHSIMQVPCFQDIIMDLVKNYMLNQYYSLF